ncbi:hypothetical protein HX001_14240 [Empedobacter brevis]|uniref:DUF4375 domain-containing protein n=1 Tax=Empedobacter brevis TaxID=247 RepID=A0AAJ1QGH7_9FLAO|nr:hypothetical protein [Empedobacter brevis]MDM1073645.1 hypothetical protein [Empedobacter brevis]
MKKIILILPVVLFIYSCNSNSNNDNALKIENKIDSSASKNDSVLEIDLLKTKTNSLRGSGSIKNVKLNDSVAEIDYVNNYNDYSKLNPQSSLSKKDFETYWYTGDAVNKALIDGAIRILRDLDFVETVKLNIPLENKYKNIELTRKDLELLTDKSFNEIKNNWTEFNDKYVYTSEGRSEILSKYGNTK